MGKKPIIVLFSLLTFLNCSSQTDYSGVWHWTSTRSTFTLTLIQKQDSLLGYHCAVAQNGNRIDCPDKSETTIRGIILKDSAIVTFRSTYSRKDGTAIIKKTDANSIFWKINKPPSGEFFLPDNAILTR
jgi:hypothetical protein